MPEPLYSLSTDPWDLHRRAEIGVAVVSATATNAMSVLSECERLVAGHPEIELLSARQRLFNEEE